MDAITRGFQNCTLAIFAQAIRDSRLPSLYGNTARQFLAPSDWARCLAELMGVDPELVGEIRMMGWSDREKRIGALLNNG